MSDPDIYARSLKDLNDDGIPDLMVYFSTSCDGVREKVERKCVSAKTRDGERIFGCNEMDAPAS